MTLVAGPQKLFAQPVVDHTCSPAACACADLGVRGTEPVASLTGLTEEEAATLLELIALGRARRATRPASLGREPV